MAWSGDIASISEDAEGLEWVIPSQGGMRFVDTMLIPIGAENKAGAEAFMNFLYDPTVSAPLFESISYVSPVNGAVAADVGRGAGESIPRAAGLRRRCTTS